MRQDRAVKFLRRNFAARIAHLDDPALERFATAHLGDMERGGLQAEQDQLSALSPFIYWGPDWWNDAMPRSMQRLGGDWGHPQSARVVLSQCLAGIDLWHEAMRADLKDRRRIGTLMEQLYSDPRAIAARGTDPRIWCAEFAPAIWSMMDDNARHAHAAKAAQDAARYLPSFQDAILFACIGLVLGAGFAENTLYPQFGAALSGAEGRGHDERRVALGTALVAYWHQIGEEIRQ